MGYEIYSQEEKFVIDYTNLSYFEIQELNYIEFLIFLRDAVIYKLNSTEKGREYLENAWRITQTEPDRKKLREKFSNN